MRLIGESGGELSAPATPETGNKALEEEEEDCLEKKGVCWRSPRKMCWTMPFTSLGNAFFAIERTLRNRALLFLSSNA